MKQAVLECRECARNYVWSEQEQEIYAGRGLDQPKYCPICRGMIEAKMKHEQGKKR